MFLISTGWSRFFELRRINLGLLDLFLSAFFSFTLGLRHEHADNNNDNGRGVAEAPPGFVEDESFLESHQLERHCKHSELELTQASGDHLRSFRAEYL